MPNFSEGEYAFDCLDKSSGEYKGLQYFKLHSSLSSSAVIHLLWIDLSSPQIHLDTISNGFPENQQKMTITNMIAKNAEAQTVAVINGDYFSDQPYPEGTFIQNGKIIQVRNRRSTFFLQSTTTHVQMGSIAQVPCWANYPENGVLNIARQQQMMNILVT